jgi:hypothetical protein
MGIDGSECNKKILLRDFEEKSGLILGRYGLPETGIVIQGIFANCRITLCLSRDFDASGPYAHSSIKQYF